MRDPHAREFEPGLEQVLALFATYQRRLYGYITTLVPDPVAAEEILHETNIVVWRKFAQFRPETDFRAWVFQIAYFEVRKYLERKRRAGPSFSPELLEQLSQAYQEEDEYLERRRGALSRCVTKLPEADRRLVDRVYGQGAEVASLAEETGRERTSIYRSLRRIRQWLHLCVDATLAAEGD